MTKDIRMQRAPSVADRASHIALCFIALVSAAFGAAPTSVAGFFYSENSNSAMPGGIRVSARRDILLREDATYLALMSVSSSSISGTVSQITYSFPPNGTWKYQRTTDTTAVLTVDGVAKSLTFVTDTSGTLPSPDFTTSVTFILTNYDAVSPLTNCSNRSFIKAGGSAILGFVTTSSSRSRLLVRAIGPGLDQFGVTDAIRRPVITVRRGSLNQVVASNSGWGNDPVIAEANKRTGAFPLATNSLDAAAVFFAGTESYIAQVTSSDPTESGEVLVEVYELP